jgi:3-dehydroquinate dehydratase/shikimate dehydrogenase
MTAEPANNVKICVSVYASAAHELFREIEAAERSADLIEIRFDCLKESELADAVSRLERDPPTTPVIATFRPKEQGGRREIAFEERADFWKRASNIPFWGVDLEEDAIPFSTAAKRRIFSFHDLSGSPNDLSEIFDRLVSLGAGIVKIAVSTDDACDAVPVWKLLERSAAAAVPIIPIAMGEAGKWTRILGGAYGAPVCYASPAAGRETAEGQIAAEELSNLFRIRSIGRDTEVYGIVAGSTSHSLSPHLHNPCFAATDRNAVFVPFQTRDIGRFVREFVTAETRLVDINLRGFAVTNPHKQTVIEHLDEIDETAREIGAVNTVTVRDGKLCGSNTDAAGFIEPLLKRFGDLSGASAAVIGAGGAARACTWALTRKGARVTVFAREEANAKHVGESLGATARALRLHDGRSAVELAEFDIIVNTTPLGTTGSFEDETPIHLSACRHRQFAYDLVYNPSETRFLREARQAGMETIGGLEMLIGQAEMQLKTWTGIEAPPGVMWKAAEDKLRNSLRY